ncbi:anti-sigma-28 factor FlgM [Caballeronia temeraria]|uniref:Negative regulator of flagellin synthesis n=1 Tax=Caballeronia temeraria TaxID=1777137 RepID=A0A158A0W0_9BURK|nr:flagellar biosynthesis anti-sigma factor FlgM [Caballeronia temeraria]SAK51431.1 anti-sigma-28 factor FlgM [Caballeronia temeraria]
MKIESSNDNALATLQPSAVRAASSSDAPNAVDGIRETGGVHADSSTVSLSSMSALRSADASDIDMAKVESIKAALRDGSYTIDSGKIADGMLSSARDMLQARTR